MHFVDVLGVQNIIKRFSKPVEDVAEKVGIFTFGSHGIFLRHIGIIHGVNACGLYSLFHDSFESGDTERYDLGDFDFRSLAAYDACAARRRKIVRGRPIACSFCRISYKRF